MVSGSEGFLANIDVTIAAQARASLKRNERRRQLVRRRSIAELTVRIVPPTTNSVISEQCTASKWAKCYDTGEAGNGNG